MDAIRCICGNGRRFWFDGEKEKGLGKKRGGLSRFETEKMDTEAKMSEMVAIQLDQMSRDPKVVLELISVFFSVSQKG